MNKFARVIVSIPVADLDQAYDYRVPEYLKERLSIGHAVKVPFGNRRVPGFIIEFRERPEIEESKVKDILSLLVDEPLFDLNMLKLIKWMAAYYKTYLITAIKAAVPTGVVTGKVGKKKLKYVTWSEKSRSLNMNKVISELEGKAPKQALILKTFLEELRGLMPVKTLVDKADSDYNTVKTLVKKGYLEYTEEIEERRPILPVNDKKDKALNPTPSQSKAIDKINKRIQEKKTQFFLLHGVTGSGKTEVYLQVISQALSENKGAIVLVPEISLTPMMVKRFYRRFGDKIAVLHSNLSLGERYDEWRRLKEGKAKVAIGARSAIFAPVQNLGLIIIDEEHENSYKQGENPYYHVREVAFKRAKIESVPVVLGSATPSLESFYWAQSGKISYLHLPERIHQEQLPPVKIVDMREELSEGNISIISRSLKEKIGENLHKDKQVLIFLNRRGYASFVLCRECGHVVKCKNCDISLTYHIGQRSLRCHYCDFRQNVPGVCPECGSKYIKSFGIGTQRIEDELRKIFPQANVARMDRDTTTRKGAHAKILDKVEKGEIDILVGTQMIAKGHDYPNIGLVGVITADNILNLPDFRAAERTFQLLTQVAGRTGRGKTRGEVILQTYNPNHYSIQAACRHDYQSFYQQEIKIRKQLFYPPFSQMVNIIIKGFEEQDVSAEAMNLGNFLRQFSKEIKDILGPSPAPLSRIRQHYRWQIILKFRGWKRRNHILNRIVKDYLPSIKKDVVVNIDVDPLQML